MNRFALAAVGALAFAATSGPALSHDVSITGPKAWYVEIEGDGTCYVRYRERPRQGVPAKFFSADAAYKALINDPACGISAGQLQQLGFGQ